MYVVVARMMLRDVAFSQSVREMPDEVEEYQPAAPCGHKRITITGRSTSAADTRLGTPRES
jgi:hypothetical protein